MKNANRGGPKQPKRVAFGAPGPRPNYGPDYYAAYVQDPDGHTIAAVTYAPG